MSRVALQGTKSALPQRAPGELCWVNLLNGLENRFAGGKFRPAVLISPDHGHWLVMGLTTSARCRSGDPRVAVPNPGRVGLRGPGYLWGPRLARISTLDIGDHIGWADTGLIERVTQLADLSASVAEALRAPVTPPGP